MFNPGCWLASLAWSPIVDSRSDLVVQVSQFPPSNIAREYGPDLLQDFKMTLRLCDKSIEGEDEGLVFTIFRPEADMPDVNATDVVLVLSAKAGLVPPPQPVMFLT